MALQYVALIDFRKKKKKKGTASQPEKLHCLFLLRCQGSVPAPKAVVAEAPVIILVMREVQGETEQVIHSWLCRACKDSKSEPEENAEVNSKQCTLSSL